MRENQGLILHGTTLKQRPRSGRGPSSGAELEVVRQELNPGGAQDCQIEELQCILKISVRYDAVQTVS